MVRTAKKRKEGVESMTSSKEDHDLLTKLSNDMAWIKRILFAYGVPLALMSFKVLISDLISGTGN